ncbi:MAG: paraquat-inducible protein A [Psychrobium sp.]|nr:paraquat-inducible protein A [Psychrobium sp.]
MFQPPREKYCWQLMILFALLFAFSIVMPLLKMLLLLYAINAGNMLSLSQQRRLARISMISKWSMLDVYVIAILAVTIKLGLIATVKIHPGLIIFTLAVVASMLLPLLITLAHRYQEKTQVGDIKIISQQYFQLQLCLNEGVLTQLLEQGELAISQEEGITSQLKALQGSQFQDSQLLDIFDNAKCWRAKVALETRDDDLLLRLKQCG